MRLDVGLEALTCFFVVPRAVLLDALAVERRGVARTLSRGRRFFRRGKALLRQQGRLDGGEAFLEPGHFVLEVLDLRLCLAVRPIPPSFSSRTASSNLPVAAGVRTAY
jgi:hypothetical protein